MSALKEFLAENIRKLLNISQQEVYLVGGFVRERLLLNTTYDYDFIVKENSLEISKALAKESKGAFVLLDPERETGRVAWNIERNNFNLNFDIAKLVGGSIESDLRLRDITINAMAIRVTEDNIEKILDENYAFSKEEIVDFSNGFEDLKNKVIRTYRKENLIDDPLRMLRVFRFIGKFNFEVENETATFIKEKASLITKPAKERVLKELFDIFSYNNASKVLSNMQEVSLLDYLFMDLKLKSKELLTEGIAKVAELEEKNFVNSKATEVENYLAQTLTLEHTKLAVLKLTLIFYYLAKEVDLVSIELFLKSNTFSYLEQQFIIKQLKLLHSTNFETLKLSRKELFHYFLKNEKETIANLILTYIINSNSSIFTNKVSEVMKIYLEDKILSEQPKIISGEDLIKELNLKPSKMLGQLLDLIKEAQAEKMVVTKEDALKFALEQLTG